MSNLSLTAIGLFFAAVLAVLITIGEVFNKKVDEGQEVVAAVFRIRVFALLEFPSNVLEVSRLSGVMDQR